MQNQKVKLTKRAVEAATPDPDREYVLWDNRLAGFGLRVRPTGARSFVFVYRTPGGRKGKTQRVTIKAKDADAAFEEAKRHQISYHRGADPAAERVQEKKA